jgi:hypothetical protein
LFDINKSDKKNSSKCNKIKIAQKTVLFYVSKSAKVPKGKNFNMNYFFICQFFLLASHIYIDKYCLIIDTILTLTLNNKSVN